MRYSIFSNSSCSLLNISSIGYSADTNTTCFGPGVRNSYIIHYVISGKGFFNQHEVGAGQGFLITPGMKEHYYADEKEPWEFLWVISGDPAMSKLFDLLNADKHTKIFEFDYLPAVKKLSSFLIENCNSTYDSFEMLEIFIGLFKHYQKNDLQNKVKTNSEVYIEAVEKYIFSNIHQKITISELTRFLGVSQPYLYKIFKEKFYKSPKQYILDQKLTSAQKLLVETNMSITYIANSVGFQDVLSFSKSFRSKFGISPQSYRKQKLLQEACLDRLSKKQ